MLFSAIKQLMFNNYITNWFEFFSYRITYFFFTFDKLPFIKHENAAI